MDKYELLEKLSEKYSITEIDINTFLDTKESMCCWSFIKYYNIHDVNPKIIDNKGAFGNLGIQIKNYDVQKESIIQDQKVYIDFMKLEKANDIKKIILHPKFSEYINFVKSDDLNEVKIISIHSIKKYLTINKTKEQNNNILIEYIEECIKKKYTIFFKIKDLKENITLLKISKKKNNDQFNFKFDNNKRYYFPFIYDYENYVSWKNIIIEKE